MTNGKRPWHRHGFAGSRSVVDQPATDADSRHGLRWETSTDAQAAYLEECDPGDRCRPAHRREDSVDLAAGGSRYGDHLPSGRFGRARRDQGDPVQCRRYPAVHDLGQGRCPRLDGRAHPVRLCRTRDRQRLCGCRRRRGADHGRQCRTFRVPGAVGRCGRAEPCQALHPDQTAGRGARRRQIRALHALQRIQGGVFDRLRPSGIPCALQPGDHRFLDLLVRQRGQPCTYLRFSARNRGLACTESGARGQSRQRRGCR